MLTNEGWTDERTEKLKELWDTKDDQSHAIYSASEIATLLGGISRNSVIGKVRRLGLSARTRGGEPRQRKVPSLRRRSRPRAKVIDLFEEMLPPADFIGIQFIETNQFTCMYPEGDGAHMLFCGQPKRDESSYCAAHHAICWIKPRGKPTRREFTSPRQKFTGAWGRVA